MNRPAAPDFAPALVIAGMHRSGTSLVAGLCQAAGLHVSRIDGSPLVYNNPDPWLPDLLVCRPELAGPVLEALWG